MTVYTKQIASARDAIRRKGEACTWLSLGAPTTPDGAQPWLVTPGADVSYTNTPILFLPLDRQWAQFIRYIRGTDVVTGSLYGLMGSVAFTPKSADTVTRASGTKLIPAFIDVLAPDGTPILYIIEFSK